MSRAKSDHHNYKLSQMNLNQSSRNQSLNGNLTRWQKPLPGQFKVNWDAACNVDRKKLGFGVIIRNDEGLVLMGTLKPLKVITVVLSQVKHLVLI